MRERSHTTPRRRGPKMALPRDTGYEDASESPYYTIDNTEDIYGVKILPSQRCYVDPWDLENYDYVRKKLASPALQLTADYYDTTHSSSPDIMDSTAYNNEEAELMDQLYFMPPTPPLEETYVMAPRISQTMPRNRRKSTHLQCQLECCVPTGRRIMTQRRYKEPSYITRDRSNKYDDYMAQMTENLQAEQELVEQNVYTGYGGISSSSSTEHHSSISDEVYSRRSSTMPRPQRQSISTNYGPISTLIRKRSKSSSNGLIKNSPPQLSFPAPPTSMPPPSSFEYSNPYATLPYCSVSDCYECQTQYGTGSMFYGCTSPSMYGVVSNGSSSNSTMRKQSSLLYDGIYGSKFGLSKKGLLQIDYSCSWNDLDRVMGRNY